MWLTIYVTLEEIVVTKEIGVLSTLYLRPSLEKEVLCLPTVDNLPGNAHIESGMCFPYLNVENIIRKYFLATSTLVYFSREYNISRKSIKYYSSKLKYNHTIVSTHGKSPTNFFLESGFASR